MGNLSGFFIMQRLLFCFVTLYCISSYDNEQDNTIP